MTPEKHYLCPTPPEILKRIYGRIMNLRIHKLLAALALALSTATGLSAAGTGLPVRVEHHAVLKMPMLRKDSLEKAAEEERNTYTFAQGFNVNYRLDEAGSLSNDEDGEAVRNVEIACENATSMGVIFNELRLSAGDTLYIVGEKGLIGPITRTSGYPEENVMLPFLDGKRLSIRLKVHEGGSLRSVRIGTVGCGFRALPNGNSAASDNCSHESAIYEITKKVKQSVCALIYYDGSFHYATGALINNTGENGIPYVLTANHAIGTAAVASTTVAFFNYESPLGRKDIRGPMEFFIAGATLIATNTNLDMTLLRLSSCPRRDFRPYLAGWNRSESPSPPFYGIHHPNGTGKRVATEHDGITAHTITVDGYTYAPYAHWKVSRWDEGTTEAGSSGSPLLDEDLRIIGALTSGASTCESPINDFYYRLSTSWDYSSAPAAQLKYWLDPTGSGTTLSDGLDPYAEDSIYRLSPLNTTEAEAATSLQTPTGATRIAQHFETKEDAILYGIHLISANAALPSRLFIFKGGLDESHLVHEEDISTPKIAQWKTSGTISEDTKTYGITNGETYIRLRDSIAVGKDFYIAYATAGGYRPYAALTESGGAYAETDGNWIPLQESDASHNALWMDVTLSRATTATAVKESSEDELISVYPNPASDWLNIETREDTKCSVNLYTLDGERIKTETYETGEGTKHRLALHGIGTGCYIAEVRTQKSCKRLKIVVIR